MCRCVSVHGANQAGVQGQVIPGSKGVMLGIQRAKNGGRVLSALALASRSRDGLGRRAAAGVEAVHGAKKKLGLGRRCGVACHATLSMPDLPLWDDKAIAV